MAFQIAMEAQGARLSGELTETVNKEHLQKQIRSLFEESGRKRLTVDFSNIHRYNSLGIQVWLEACQGIPLSYVRCPYWQVECFNIEIDFLIGDVIVESILAPFQKDNQDEVSWRLLHLGPDIPLLEDYSDFQPPFFQDADSALSPLFDESYLSFIPSIKSRLEAVKGG